MPGVLASEHASKTSLTVIPALATRVEISTCFTFTGIYQ
jgi:hypothetical protein